ncbi:MAG: hypothetical protein SGPRY_013554 [Prymnesium sp.]
MQWEHAYGLSAGAGQPGSRLLGSPVTFGACLALCESDGQCAAVEFVRKHADLSRPRPPPPPRAGGHAGPVACGPSAPRKQSCYAVSPSSQPCLPQTTEAILSRRVASSAAPAGARSVLHIIFDDLRAVDDPFVAAVPVASALRERSVSFLSAHAQSAICAPSRASFFSGRRPDLTRVLWTDTHLRQHAAAARWLTLPQHFKRHGYYTAGAGKLFHHLPDPISLDPASWNEPECVADYPYYGQGHCPEKPEFLYHAFNTSAGCPVEASRHPDYVFTDVQVVRKAREFLRRAAPKAIDGSQPFWIGVGFFKPHKPFVFPAHLLHRFPPPHSIELPHNLHPPNGAQMASIPELCATKGQHSLQCARDTIRTYHAAAAFTDGLLGELLTELTALKLSESTLVVVMSDHGFALGEHGAWAKWSNWEVATRSLLMIRAPWLPETAGRRLLDPVELVDLFPTVATLVGVPVPPSGEGYEELGGRDLSPLVTGSRNSTGTAAFSQMARCWPPAAPHNASSFSSMGQCDQIPPSEYAFMGYSIRTASRRYTQWVPVSWDAHSQRQLPQWDAFVGEELYDHSDDRGGSHWNVRFENENLASQRPEEVARLRSKLHAHFDATLTAALRTSNYS